MKAIIKLEEAMMLTASLLLFREAGFSWLWFGILFLSPDIGFLGYLINTKTGAAAYNLLHHKGIALLVYIIGASIHSRELEFAGILLFAHSSFDRIFGYGLKYRDSFHHTHLGMIGKKGILNK